MSVQAPRRRLRVFSSVGAELLGTFGFVFLGGFVFLAVPSPWASLAFGPAVGAMIYLLAPASGAHFNPVVTVSLLVNRCFPLWRAPGYIAVQLFGATGAVGALHVLFAGGVESLRTVPVRGVPIGVVFLAEVVSTFLLVFAILRASCRAVKRWDASLTIGGAVAAGILMAGPLSSAAMNPARTLGPAFVLGRFEQVWLYLAGPLVGGLAAVWLFRAAGLGGRCREVLLCWSGEAKPPGDGT